MAKGGNNQRNNGSRFRKPYDVSNSFVKKVALRFSDYFGGLFGSSLKSDDSIATDRVPFRATDDTSLTHTCYEPNDSLKTLGMPRHYDDHTVKNSPAKQLKIGSKRKFETDLPITSIASTSSLFQSSVNHNFDIQSSDNYVASVAGPSGLQNQKYEETNSFTTPTSSSTNIKVNGATDNHSDSSESTSGCSSLVPQSGRLSQSAFVSNSRKKILEDKLHYARQLKQSRSSMYLNRSVSAVSEAAGNRRKPTFDVSAYGSPIYEKSSVREKMVSSPFYTGETSYGGASAYRRPRTALYYQQSGRNTLERRDGLQIQVKPSHHGSTEDLSNMSRTAKRILEALEQFSTPVSDAKRIPVNAVSPPLGTKRKRLQDHSESRLTLSGIKTPLNQTKGPLISGLSIPTVPDLLKLKRLERIQDSTAAARQVAVQKQEYSLPTDVLPSKHTGKIITKKKDKGREMDLELPPDVNLPKISLPISTLPKFDFKLPPIAAPTTNILPTTKPLQTEDSNKIMPTVKPSESNKTFSFSPPISLPVPANIEGSMPKSNFTFSSPLKADTKLKKSENADFSNLTNFMSNEAMSKLKRKSTSEKRSSFGLEPAEELKSGSVMDVFRKSLESSKKPETEPIEKQSKPLNDTWECGNCLIRNINDNKNCSGCKTPKASVLNNKNAEPSQCESQNGSMPAANVEKEKVEVKSGFGNKFKPPSGSWSCKECFVNNNSTATKCIACESPRSQTGVVSKPASEVKPIGNGFGNAFKKKSGQWECSVCLIQNKETDMKCAACENPKPGAKVDKAEPPKFNFGIPAGAAGFKFGIDKADVKTDDKNFAATIPVSTPPNTTAQSNGPCLVPSTKPLNSVATSFGVFTFGIQATSQEKVENICEKKVDSGKNEPEKPNIAESSSEKIEAMENSNITPPAKSEVFKTKAESVTDGKSNDSSKTSIFGAQSFSFGVPKNPVSTLFGLQTNSAKPEGANITEFKFGNSLKMPEKGFIFGMSNPVNLQTNLNNTSDWNKPSLPKFGFPSKVEPGPLTTSSSADLTKNSEKITDAPTTIASSSTPATKPIFGSPSVFDPKQNLTFGIGNTDNLSGIGATNKAANSDASNLNVTTGFPASSPMFSAASSVFNGPAVTTAANSCGPVTSATPTFTTSTTLGFTSVSEQKFRPSTEVSFASSAPTFGSFGSQMPSFGIFNRPTSNISFDAKTKAPEAPFGSSFGQPANTSEKQAAPCIFGATATSTSAPTTPTTASNIFTFGATKIDAKPSLFSSSFGSGAAFTFGNPNPSGGSIFSGLNQTKPVFPSVNSTFGNSGGTPFVQNSAPPSFGETTPKFEFGMASQQSKSSAQPFQFGATTPQTQVNSAPVTTFSTSVPSVFNFTKGQAPESFSATPTTSASAPPLRRVIKAVRRTHR